MGYTPLSYILTQVSGQSSYAKSELLNNSGSAISGFIPVRANTSGELGLVNVAMESASSIVGITLTSIPNGNSGDVVTSGKIENINSFDLGDVIYVSKSGGLTNTKPEIGVDSFVAGDWIISVGVIAKNQSNPSNKDLFVNIQIIGQL